MVNNWTTSKMNWLPLVACPFWFIFCSVTRKYKSDHTPFLMKPVCGPPIACWMKNKILTGSTRPHEICTAPAYSLSFNWEGEGSKPMRERCLDDNKKWQTWYLLMQSKKHIDVNTSSHFNINYHMVPGPVLNLFPLNLLSPSLLLSALPYNLSLEFLQDPYKVCKLSWTMNLQ